MIILEYSVSNMRRCCCRWFVGIVALVVLLRVALARDDRVVSRIAFGSCANQSSPQLEPMWNAINDFNPQIFIWLGDNIYGDIKRSNKLFGKERTIGPWKNVPKFVPATKEEMETKYSIAKSNPGYSRLRKNAQVIGTWDDHDYGLNNAGKEFVWKTTNQKLLLDFLDEPHDSPRRNQAGVYASYTFGPKNRQVKIILLDTRYHRDPIPSNGTILGNSQWTWLENELNGPASAITIIGSSVQVISNLSATTRPLLSTESWGRFPEERERLFKLIKDSKRDGVFFISGDVHFSEITRYDCAVGYPLYDITSSGITQSIENVVPQLLRFVVRFLSWWTPNTMRVMNANCKYRSCTYGKPNFGAIEIDWDASPVSLRIEVRDVNNHAVGGVNITLSELSVPNGNSTSINRAEKTKRHCALEVTLPWIVRYRLAILIFTTLSVAILASAGLFFGIIFLCYRCLHKNKVD